jgi:hypothetical protein
LLCRALYLSLDATISQVVAGFSGILAPIARAGARLASIVEGHGKRPHTGMPLVLRTEQRNPVEGIDEEAIHAGRFGVP